MIKTSGIKTLLLIRHAKSSWADDSLSDFERPLNDRGKHDAPMMAERLHKRGIKIDAFVSSPAKRAKKTCEHFAKQYGKKTEKINYRTELYMAGENAFLEVISSLENKWDTVAIFSHNPGITEFANSLTNARVDNIPTTGIFAVSIHADSWKDVEKAKKEFLFFDYPKAVED